MPADAPDRGLQDRSRIDLSQDHEVRFWADKLGCTEAKLRRIVVRIGNSADAIRRVLQASQPRSAQ